MHFICRIEKVLLIRRMEYKYFYKILGPKRTAILDEVKKLVESLPKNTTLICVPFTHSEWIDLIFYKPNYYSCALSPILNNMLGLDVRQEQETTPVFDCQHWLHHLLDDFGFPIHNIATPSII